MSGDVGAALEPAGASMYVDDFDEHIPKMEMFHHMAPQHGRIFKGENVEKFLNWFEKLDVGTAIK